VLSFQSLTDDRLDEAIAFLRGANPFSQHTWGWDTGRFIDFRWGANILRADARPDFFARNGTVIRTEGGTIVALIVSEVGEDDHCILTVSPDPALLASALRWLEDHYDGEYLVFFPSDEADWIHEVLRDFGFARGEIAGLEWGYDLTRLDDPGPAPEGFVVDSLSDARDADYIGIDQCLEGAFGGKRDRVRVLRSLETNPMFRPELSIVARAADGRIAAYCKGEADAETGVCGIDPVATHPDFQGRGLGKAIVRACFAAQAELGGTESYIGSAPEGSAGSHLYRSLGPQSVTSHSTWKKALR
jgi:ribosomal protein S18 acetylase RimI-like enzyme